MEKKIGKNVSSGAKKVESLAEDRDQKGPAPTQEQPSASGRTAAKRNSTGRKKQAAQQAVEAEHAAADARFEAAKARAAKKEAHKLALAQKKQEKLTQKLEAREKKEEAAAASKSERAEKLAAKAARKQMLATESAAERTARRNREKRARLAERRQKQEAREQKLKEKQEARKKAQEKRASQRRDKKKSGGGKKRAPGIGGWIAAVSVLGAACLALATVVTAGYFRMNDMMVQSANGYRATLYEMVSVSEDMDDNFAKLRVSSGANEQRTLLTEILVDSAMLESALEKMPVDAATGTDISAFVNRTGAAARAMLHKLSSGGTLSQEDRERIAALYETNATLCAELNDLALHTPAEEMQAFFDGAQGDVSNRLSELGQGMRAERKEIRDVPFAGEGNVEENQLAGTVEIPASEAEQKVRQYFEGYQIADVRPAAHLRVQTGAGDPALFKATGVFKALHRTLAVLAAGTMRGKRRVDGNAEQPERDDTQDPRDLGLGNHVAVGGVDCGDKYDDARDRLHDEDAPGRRKLFVDQQDDEIGQEVPEPEDEGNFRQKEQNDRQSDDKKPTEEFFEHFVLLPPCGAFLFLCIASLYLRILDTAAGKRRCGERSRQAHVRPRRMQRSKSVHARKGVRIDVLRGDGTDVDFRDRRAGIERVCREHAARHRDFCNRFGHTVPEIRDKQVRKQPFPLAPRAAFRAPGEGQRQLAERRAGSERALVREVRVGQDERSCRRRGTDDAPAARSIQRDDAPVRSVGRGDRDVRHLRPREAGGGEFHALAAIERRHPEVCDRSRRGKPRKDRKRAVIPGGWRIGRDQRLAVPGEQPVRIPEPARKGAHERCTLGAHTCLLREGEHLRIAARIQRAICRAVCLRGDNGTRFSVTFEKNVRIVRAGKAGKDGGIALLRDAVLPLA